MRLYLKLTPNRETVPFNYQQSLVGAFHKWLGENELHSDTSLYSLSWLKGGRMRKDKKGLEFKSGATFCISSPLQELHKLAVQGIFTDQEIRWGMKVGEVAMRPTPKFESRHRFLLNSPVLIKRKEEDRRHQRYYFYTDVEADQLMTRTLYTKMKMMNLEGDIRLSFDKDYTHPKIRKTTFNQIDIKASMCPVIAEGDPELIQFVWDVGVGNSTGIGFGGVR